MTDIQSKLTAFDYVISKLIDWYADKNGQWSDENDLSKLKLTKLLFFVSAVNAEPNNPSLLETFDNFVAMPYGHVESDLQDHISQLVTYEITSRRVSFKPAITAYSEEAFTNIETKGQIDNAISKLREINDNLINYEAFSLVDLSHKWQSWRTVFSLARTNSKYSMPIPQQMIMVEPKILK